MDARAGADMATAAQQMLSSTTFRRSSSSTSSKSKRGLGYPLRLAACRRRKTPARYTSTASSADRKTYIHPSTPQLTLIFRYRQACCTPSRRLTCTRPIRTIRPLRVRLQARNGRLSEWRQAGVLRRMTARPSGAGHRPGETHAAVTLRVKLPPVSARAPA